MLSGSSGLIRSISPNSGDGQMRVDITKEEAKFLLSLLKDKFGPGYSSIALNQPGIGPQTIGGLQAKLSICLGAEPPTAWKESK